MAQAWFDVDEIAPDVWRINDGDLDTIYVLRGARRTAVIDTGMGVGDLAALVAEIAPPAEGAPLVVNTHAHPDHVAGNHQFDEITMGAEEWPLYQRWYEEAQARREAGETISALDLMQPQRPLPPGFRPEGYTSYHPLSPSRLWRDGEVIDLGGLQLEVILAPAHTPGGICLLERRRGLLFTGDTVLRGVIWLHLEDSTSFAQATASYARLAGLAGVVTHVLPAHGTEMLPGTFLTDLAGGMQRILRGEIAPEAMVTFAGDGYYYDLGGYGPLTKERFGGDDAARA